MTKARSSISPNDKLSVMASNDHHMTMIGVSSTPKIREKRPTEVKRVGPASSKDSTSKKEKSTKNPHQMVRMLDMLNNVSLMGKQVKTKNQKVVHSQSMKRTEPYKPNKAQMLMKDYQSKNPPQTPKIALNIPDDMSMRSNVSKVRENNMLNLHYNFFKRTQGSGQTGTAKTSTTKSKTKGDNLDTD